MHHFSKLNRQIVLQIVPLLKNVKTSVEVKTTDPKRLAYILKEARETDEFSWIKDKFRIYTKKAHVFLQLKDLDLLIQDLPELPSMDIEVDNNEADLLYISSKLIVEKPKAIQFTNFSLDDGDIHGLSDLCDQHNYAMQLEDYTLTIVKHG